MTLNYILTSIKEFIATMRETVEEMAAHEMLTEDQYVGLIDELNAIFNEIYLVKTVPTKTEISDGLRALIAATHGFEFTFKTKDPLTKENLEDAKTLAAQAKPTPSITIFTVSSGVNADQIKYDVPLKKADLYAIIKHVQNSIDIKRPEKVFIIPGTQDVIDIPIIENEEVGDMRIIFLVQP